MPKAILIFRPWLSPPNVFFITSLGYIGIGPKGMKAGDQVVTFDGEKTVFVLQRVQGIPHIQSWTHLKTTIADIRESWELIRDYYLHGFIDNEVEESE